MAHSLPMPDIVHVLTLGHTYMKVCLNVKNISATGNLCSY